MIPTREPPFGKWSPNAAFDFDVFAADEEPEVLLGVLPTLVAVALATCTDEKHVNDEDKGWDDRHIQMKNLSRLRSCHYLCSRLSHKTT